MHVLSGVEYHRAVIAGSVKKDHPTTKAKAVTAHRSDVLETIELVQKLFEILERDYVRLYEEVFSARPDDYVFALQLWCADKNVSYERLKSEVIQLQSGMHKNASYVSLYLFSVFVFE